MKISLDWLSDYIEIERSAKEIAEILSDLGFPCEGIEQIDSDTVIDVEVTNNRGDCLSYIGIARELSVATGNPLKMPVVDIEQSDTDAGDFVEVEIAEPDLCSRYTARVIEGVTVGPSPDWMAKRLQAVGLRSVSNVVDATNYAMLETGQPPHAFDYAKIEQGKIIVRKAIPGERIVSIDGSQCDLTADMLVIADASGPVAIAGVMGGLHTEVGDTTKTILLEDAYFDPVSVRTTSRRLCLPSEAAFRFERIVDTEAIDWASRRTAQLIVQVAGGRIANGLVDAYPVRKEQAEVTMRFSRLNRLLGIEVAREEAIRILAALGFAPKADADTVVCTLPTWRSDVSREVDLIEEVARVYGYGRIPTEDRIRIVVAPVDSRQKLAQSVGRFLNACGFYETVTVSFVDEATAELFAGGDVASHLRVHDVSGKSANLLRQTLMGSLLGVLKTNLNAKNTPCRIFEIAETFVGADGPSGTLPVERARLTVVCDSDLRDIHGVVEGLVKNINKSADIVFEPAELVWAQAGANVLVNGKIIGSAGIVSQAVRAKFDFEDVKPVAAELDFEMLLALQGGPVKVKPIPRFPEIERDLSIVVDEQVRWADILEAVKKHTCNELEDVRFVDIYRGRGIAAGSKSLTLSLRFRDEDGTLTHEAVDNFQKTIVDNLTECVQAQLRTL